jgi:hypothetical protein
MFHINVLIPIYIENYTFLGLSMKQVKCILQLMLLKKLDVIISFIIWLIDEISNCLIISTTIEVNSRYIMQFLIHKFSPMIMTNNVHLVWVIEG